MSEDFMPLSGWDYIELWVGNAKQAAYFYEHGFGFTRTAYAGPETGVRDRASYEFALTSAAVGLGLDGRTIRSSRIALGGVGTKPWRSLEAESMLTGKTASTDVFRAAAEAALRGAKAKRQNGFKVELAKNTIVRALETVSGRTA